MLTQLASHALTEGFLAQVCMTGAGFQDLIITRAEGCLL